MIWRMIGSLMPSTRNHRESWSACIKPLKRMAFSTVLRFTALHLFLCCSLLLLGSAATAEVKDSHGNALGVGLPAKPTADFDGGRIGTGYLAKCVLGADAPAVCTFYPRNEDGSFAIDLAGRAYYAVKSSAVEITVDYDNGARMVPLGRFTRSRRDPACWLQGGERGICIYRSTDTAPAGEAMPTSRPPAR